MNEGYCLGFFTTIGRTSPEYCRKILLLSRSTHTIMYSNTVEPTFSHRYRMNPVEFHQRITALKIKRYL